MLLVCIPGLQLAGMIVVGLASLLYLTKHAQKLHGFFKDQPANDSTFEAQSVSQKGGRHRHIH